MKWQGWWWIRRLSSRLLMLESLWAELRRTSPRQLAVNTGGCWFQENTHFKSSQKGNLGNLNDCCNTFDLKIDDVFQVRAVISTEGDHHQGLHWNPGFQLSQTSRASTSHLWLNPWRGFRLSVSLLAFFPHDCAIPNSCFRCGCFVASFITVSTCGVE